MKLTINDHLLELKKRLIFMLLCFLVASIVSYIYADNIFTQLVKPLLTAADAPKRLIFTGLTEGFFTQVKLALCSGFVLASPVIISQVYFFIAPGLYTREKKVLLPYLILSPLLFIAGASLVYYYVMPLAWEFFLSFERMHQGLQINLETRISEYLDLVLGLMIAFGLAFQLPMILTLLAHLQFIDGNWLRKQRKFAIVGMFVLAAVLTPPDIISQICLAVPLILLYEIAIMMCNRIAQGQKRQEGDNNARYKENT
jgi:sec-independent protein translocase protein TatC